VRSGAGGTLGLVAIAIIFIPVCDTAGNSSSAQYAVPEGAQLLPACLSRLISRLYRDPFAVYAVKIQYLTWYKQEKHTRIQYFFDYYRTSIKIVNPHGIPLIPARPW
jgi:hypothetical protein